MENFYFTYGTSSDFPFFCGWTTIKAESREMAAEAFRKVHPNPKDPSTLNCAFMYSEEEFRNSSMGRKNSNMGHGEWENLDAVEILTGYERPEL